MFIASKYEEIYPPRIQDFVTSAKGAFSKEEIFEMEFCMLSTLDFNVHFTSSYDFLGRYAFLAKATTPERNFAQYLLEASFIEYPMLKYSLANLAASALYFALRIMRQETSETRQKNWGV
jgi:cyclin B